MSAAATTVRHTEDVACTVNISHTPEELFAHVSLHGVDVEPGDVVLVRAAELQIAYGQHVACACRATVVRAGWLLRVWTRVSGYFALSALYEVSFTPARLDIATCRKAAKARHVRGHHRAETQCVETIRAVTDIAALSSAR